MLTVNQRQRTNQRPRGRRPAEGARPLATSQARAMGLSRTDLQLLQACLGDQARQQVEPALRGRLLRLRQKLAVLEAIASAA